MPEITIHNPDVLGKPLGQYSQITRVKAYGVYPPNTLLIVDRLVQEPFLIEVQTVAAL